MIKNHLRIGNFTSSEIANLMKKDRSGKGFGAPALTYIEETNMERRLARSLTDEVNARPLTWGKLIEERVFDMLGMEYILSSTDTIQHKQIPYWAGSKDGIKHDEGKTVIDIKSPVTLKSFCQLVQPLYDGLCGIAAMNEIRENHKDGDKYYWQLVSNSILDDTKFAELIVYMPFESELEDIKFAATNVPTQDLSKHYWIAMANDGELPFIKNGGYYNNINVIRFEVPIEDKEALTEMVIKAGQSLIDMPSIIIASDSGIDNVTIIDNK